MTLSRRRFLTIASVSCLGAAAPVSAAVWQGTALGARARILLDHPDADRLLAMVRSEVTRLEKIFSLYRPDSELVRLNASGRLLAPSFELLDCLALARQAHRLTQGLFDPTVQPLWVAEAEARSVGQVPDAARISAARARIGFDRVRIGDGTIALDDGQALTLNGIAQGYIADRVMALLRTRGVRDVLVDTGEIVTRGSTGNHAGWPVSLAPGGRRLILRDRAIASSATHGTVLDGAGLVGHILDPVAGDAPVSRFVSVSAPRAALADAVSTGLCLVSGRAQADALVAGHPGIRIEAFDVL